MTDRPRFSISRYSAKPGTGKCMQCGAEDYQFILVERRPPNVMDRNPFKDDDSWRPQLTSVACWCSRCMVKLAVEMLEYAHV